MVKNGQEILQIAMVLLFDRHNRLLVYLRDDKPDIPFPGHWDFFGGHLEDRETPDEALVREVKEELDVDLKQWQFFRTYQCLQGDAYPNVKHLYWAKIDKCADELTLYEGQRLRSIEPHERNDMKFANVLGQILEDFITAGFWPEPVDNSR
jgi:8-oxo-dGTP diphosphatase